MKRKTKKMKRKEKVYDKILLPEVSSNDEEQFEKFSLSNFEKQMILKIMKEKNIAFNVMELIIDYCIKNYQGRIIEKAVDAISSTIVRCNLTNDYEQVRERLFGSAINLENKMIEVIDCQNQPKKFYSKAEEEEYLEKLLDEFL